MAVHSWAASLNPGQVHNWWTNYYSVSEKPQLDAYPTTPYSKIKYYDCKCKRSSGGLTYYISVKNEGPYPVSYRMRVWVP